MPKAPNPRAFSVPLFGGSRLEATDSPRVYGLVFLTWRPKGRDLPLTFGLEPDAARELRDVLDYLVGDGPEPEPVDQVDPPAALFPLDELRADRVDAREARRSIAATGLDDVDVDATNERRRRAAGRRTAPELRVVR